MPTTTTTISNTESIQQVRMEENDYRKASKSDSRANWAVWLLVALCVLLAFGIVNLTCATETHRLLIVQLADESNKVSEVDVVRQALVRGGLIVVDAEIAQRIDPSFQERFAVSDSKFIFLTGPAIFNWLGDDSWEFKQAILGMNYFTKAERNDLLSPLIQFLGKDLANE